MPSSRRVNANLSTNIATDVGVPKRAPIELADSLEIARRAPPPLCGARGLQAPH